MTSKRYKALKKSETDKSELISKLLPQIRENCSTKFDESIDLNLQINNKQKKNEVNIRTAVTLPSGSGKKITVAVVCEEEKTNDAKKAGADIIGGDELIEKIKSGETNFETLICTPSMMIKLSKLGKILGPKGLMPNPKLRNDKDGNIGLSIGKKSFLDQDLIKNFNAIIDALDKEKSNNNVKGNLIKNLYITSTMGVSFKLKLEKSI